MSSLCFFFSLVFFFCSFFVKVTHHAGLHVELGGSIFVELLQSLLVSVGRVSVCVVCFDSGGEFCEKEGRRRKAAGKGDKLFYGSVLDDCLEETITEVEGTL